MSKIVFGPDGSFSHIYDEELESLSKELAGNQERITRRASHVEPTAELAAKVVQKLAESGVQARPDDWWADMSPMGGPVLGPFNTRTDALAAEQEWLDVHHLRCQTCEDQDG